MYSYMCTHLYGRCPMCPVCVVCCSRESADQGVTVIVDNRQNYYKNLKYYLRIISVSRPHQATTMHTGPRIAIRSTEHVDSSAYCLALCVVVALSVLSIRQ